MFKVFWNERIEPVIVYSVRVSEFRNGERDTVFLIYNDKTGHWIWIDADETRPVK